MLLQLTLDTRYGWSLEFHQEWCLNAESRVYSEHYQMWPKIKTRNPKPYKIHVAVKIVNYILMLTFFPPIRFNNLNVYIHLVADLKIKGLELKGKNGCNP